MGQVSETSRKTVDGVSAESSVWTADNARLSVTQLEFTSQRDDAVVVHFVEDVPAGIPLDDLGPHPKYGGDKWRKHEDGMVAFTDVLEPDGTSFTIYGAKGLDATQVESFLTDPAVEVHPVDDEPPSGDTHSETMTSDQSTTNDEPTENQSATKRSGDFDDLIPRVDDPDEATNGEFESAEGSENGDDSDELRFVGTDVRPADERPLGPEEPESFGPRELQDQSETAVTRAEETDDSNGSDADSADSPESNDKGDSSFDDDNDLHTDSTAVEVSVEQSLSEDDSESNPKPNSEVDPSPESESDFEPEPPTESVVASLVAELSSGNLSDDDAEVIRKSLGISTPNSLEARLQNVRTRMDDLAVYTDALEDFIDENGTAEQLLSDLQDDSDEMRRDLTEVDEALSATNAALESIEEQVELLENRAVSESELEARLGEFDEKFVEESSLDDELLGLTENFSALSDELSTVRSEVEQGKTWRSNMSRAAQIPDSPEVDDEVADE